MLYRSSRQPPRDTSQPASGGIIFGPAARRQASPSGQTWSGIFVSRISNVPAAPLVARHLRRGQPVSSSAESSTCPLGAWSREPAHVSGAAVRPRRILTAGGTLHAAGRARDLAARLRTSWAHEKDLRPLGTQVFVGSEISANREVGTHLPSDAGAERPSRNRAVTTSPAPESGRPAAES